jgi:hypothetical protein
VKAYRNLLSSSLAMLLLGNAGFALAQEAEDAPVLRKKTIIADPYAPTGFGAGALRLFPKFEVNSFYTTNATGAATNPKSDVAVELKPSLRFASDWSRHSWSGSASANLLRYVENPKFSTVSGRAETAFRLDILRTTTADFSASYGLNSLGIGSSELPTTAISSRQDQDFKMAAGLTHNFGGLEGSIKTVLQRGLFSTVSLSGGGTENNSDLNYWSPAIALRASLNDVGASLKPFAEITYQPRIHDHNIDRNGLKRNSQGLQFNAGLALARGPIWEGDVALTYLLRNYADPSLKTSHAAGLSTNLTWRPTALTSLTVTSGVGLDETSTLGIAATRNWNASLNLKHELRDNIDVQAGLGFTVQNSGSKYDLTNTANLGFNWQLNPIMTVGLNYQGTWFNAASAGGDYNEQRIMSSIILQR